MKIFLTILLCLGLAFTASADSKDQLLYSRLTDGTWQIWVTKMQDRKQKQLTFSPGDKRTPSWGPDGRIAYTTSNQECYVIPMDQPKAAAIPLFEDLWPMRDLCWSLNGSQVVFSKFQTDLADSANLWVSDNDGKNRHLLTKDIGIQYHPIWSPDGTRIAYSGGHGYHTYEIYVINADGTNKRQLTHTQAHTFLPAWSPDGKRIAYSSNVGGTYDLWVIDVDGGTPVQLTNSPALDTRPVWSPDGTQIAFVTNRSGLMEIWIMNADGTNQHLLEQAEGGVCDPAWQ